MKKLLFVVILILLTVVIYGQERRMFTNSEGSYFCTIEYIGKNQGNENAELFGGPWTDNIRIEKLSNIQLEYVRRMLNLYQRSRGDTFFIRLGDYPYWWHYDYPFSTFIVIVEYDSNTEWIYWAFKQKS